MLSVAQRRVPDESLLKTYRGGLQPDTWRDSGDCFELSVNRSVSLAEFVFAFYTSWVFKLERVIIGVLVGAPSTDEEAGLLASGAGTLFAVWRVGERTVTQLLMCDRSERTRSWFRVVPLGDGTTMLQFGSAVAAPSGSPPAGARKAARGRLFWLLMKFHVIYSQVLLHEARRRVVKLARRRAPLSYKE